jgi:hypothetical protein
LAFWHITDSAAHQEGSKSWPGMGRCVQLQQMNENQAEPTSHVHTIYPCSRFPGSPWPWGRRAGLHAPHARTHASRQAGVDVRVRLLARILGRCASPRHEGAPALAPLLRHKLAASRPRAYPATSESAPTAGERRARRVLHVRTRVPRTTRICVSARARQRHATCTKQVEYVKPSFSRTPSFVPKTMQFWNNITC